MERSPLFFTRSGVMFVRIVLTFLSEVPSEAVATLRFPPRKERQK